MPENNILLSTKTQHKWDQWQLIQAPETGGRGKLLPSALVGLLLGGKRWRNRIYTARDCGKGLQRMGSSPHKANLTLTW